MSTDDFGLDIEIYGAGWLKATIRGAGQELQSRASYASDALRDLALAAWDMGVESVGPRARMFSWWNEPDFWRWDFVAEHDGMIRVAVAYVEDADAWVEDAAVRFEARVSTHDLIAAVLGGLDDVLRSGLETYEEAWGPKRFPYVLYAQLRELLLRADAGGNPADL